MAEVTEVTEDTKDLDFGETSVEYPHTLHNTRIEKKILSQKTAFIYLMQRVKRLKVLDISSRIRFCKVT